MTERTISFPDDLKPKWIDRFVADVHAHIRGVTSLENETYPAPHHGWICFHCGERFTTKEGAAIHFGTVNDDRPDCIERLHTALGQIAGKNDMEGVADADLQSALGGALHECEVIARAALGEYALACDLCGGTGIDPNTLNDPNSCPQCSDEFERERDPERLSGERRMTDPRSPPEQFHYLMSGAQAARVADVVDLPGIAKAVAGRDEETILRALNEAFEAGRETAVTGARVEAAYKAFCDACNEMIECPGCNGKGYHHGFGEHGHDPDWCLNCGGSQIIPARDDIASMRMALVAALGVGQ